MQNTIETRIKELKDLENQQSELYPPESYELDFLQTLVGYYDDIEDLANITIALSRVQALVQGQIIQGFLYPTKTGLGLQ